MIPARQYMNLVRQWAEARGMKFFTMRDMMKALSHYEIFAASKN